MIGEKNGKLIALISVLVLILVLGGWEVTEGGSSELQTANDAAFLRSRLASVAMEEYETNGNIMGAGEKYWSYWDKSVEQGTMLIVEVFGSQPRIGCTTQCLQLFHYFTSVGFAPAVIVTQEQRQLLQKLMGGKNIGEAVVIDAIPFLTSVHSGYDCFIRDGGCMDKGKAERTRTADVCVLVAGSKPWELTHSATALALVRNLPHVLTVASFSEDTDVLKTLLQKLDVVCPVLRAPWQPSPFSKGKEDAYEAMRPLVEQIILEEL